jgi:hypothetical protein
MKYSLYGKNHIILHVNYYAQHNGNFQMKTPLYTYYTFSKRSDNGAPKAKSVDILNQYILEGSEF